MKRTQVNEILSFQTIRRRKVLGLSLLVIVAFLISLSFLFIYIDGNHYKYVKYQEKNKTTYKVHLKENEFFDSDYLEKDNEYISSLIDHIIADFNYFLSVEEEVTYNYSYYIESNVYIKRKDSTEFIYNNTETILKENIKNVSKSNVSIKESINVDYNKYNNLMKKFINIYGLDDIESILTINMYINVNGNCDNFVDNQKKESVLSIKIPLTTRVVDVESSDNLINNEDNLIECKKNIEDTTLLFIIFISFLCVSILLLIITIRYSVKTRTDESIYQKELKKILNNYGSYIQTLTSAFNFKDYQILRIKSFNDMLEISDTINQPILMKENEEKTGAYFLILTGFNVLYIYRLNVNTIHEDIENNK